MQIIMWYFQKYCAHIELTPSEKQAYENWMKSDYLSEFDNGTREYTIYPSTGSPKKKESQLKACE